MSDMQPEPVDLDKLRLRFDNDEELLGEIFQVFISETPDRRVGIEAAWTSGDLPLLTRMAHSLKGVAGTMFAEPLRQSAYDLEMAARAEDRAVAGRLVSQVLDLLDTTAAFVGRLI